MTIMSWVNAQTNSFKIEFSFCTLTNDGQEQLDRFHINLPSQEGQPHPSCYKFVNSVVCPFLHAHIGKLRELSVFCGTRVPQLLSKILATLGGKGIPNLSLRSHAGGISFERRQEELFRPLLSLEVDAVADRTEHGFHAAELGRLVSFSTNLESLSVRVHRCLTDAGFDSLFRGLHFLQKLENPSWANFRWVPSRDSSTF